MGVRTSPKIIQKHPGHPVLTKEVVGDEDVEEVGNVVVVYRKAICLRVSAPQFQKWRMQLRGY